MATASIQLQAHPVWNTPPTVPSPYPQAHEPPVIFNGHALAAHNNVEMTRDMLITVLNHLSLLLPQRFGHYAVRLVVHGGACMLLHPSLHQLAQQQKQKSPASLLRTKTRDIDYIHRSFIKEMASFGVNDAAEKLRECVLHTAVQFNLGADWVNSDPDVALPMAYDKNGGMYDPIYDASIQPNNISLHTVYRSPNGMLTLISVTPYWSIALKLVRYTRWDPSDICLLLRNGTVLSGVNWTSQRALRWLYEECRAMGFHNFDAKKKADIESRIEDALQLLNATWGTSRVERPDGVKGTNSVSTGTVGTTATAQSQHGWWSMPDDTRNDNHPFIPPAVGPPPASFAPTGPPTQVQQAQPPLNRPVNVRDWIAQDEAEERDRRLKGGHGPRSRQASRSRSRTVVSRQATNDVFIPPFPDDDLGGPSMYGSAATRSSSPEVDHRLEYDLPKSRNGPRTARQSDVYGFEGFTSTLPSRNANIPQQPSPSQSMPPVVKERKRKEKARKRTRDMDRGSKWDARGVDEDSTDEEENLGRRSAEIPQFQIYGPPAGQYQGALTGSTSTSQTPYRHQHSQSVPQMRISPHGSGSESWSNHSSPQYLNGGLVVPQSSRSRPGSRDPSPGPKATPAKHRPPPIAVPPPPGQDLAGTAPQIPPVQTNQPNFPVPMQQQQQQPPTMSRMMPPASVAHRPVIPPAPQFNIYGSQQPAAAAAMYQQQLMQPYYQQQAQVAMMQQQQLQHSQGLNRLNGLY